ncbi:hypothetical protein [Acidaminobacter sp.]|uniref:hypothetical protein n=1 Tax=Acidaminobacter sp. TaxID=1872102 RepID=UPI00137F9D02|nr:hypothetical protein [Acidaminobacter sp.]MDK9709892.1 hypothetical protein [Acidaminobacter sp.]MZQ97469.1 hypothetical protein [Acidaminobacter sp.]
MKGYIVLNNGMVINGNFEGKTANVLGSISCSDTGSISIHCDANGTCVTIVDASAPAGAADGIFTTDAFDLLASKLSTGENHLAKLVIDDLPFDYHLYDVKTWLGYNHPIAS